jgi:DNA-binding response OmpR family regulator
VTTESARAIRILVIDDDEALLRMLRMSMSAAGFDVTTARDGVAGLEQIEAAQFDVVVLDLQMPRMDGRTFCRELANRSDRPAVVIISAYGAEDARRELRAAAALAKPFDPDYLAETVRRVSEAQAGGSR